MESFRATVDTSVLDTKELPRIEHAIRGLAIELAYVTVSVREMEGTSFALPPIAGTSVGPGAWHEPVFETMVIGESRLGCCVVGSDDTPYEAILRVISNGSFPRPGFRDNLTWGEKHQLRDAIILEAHWRDKRDILVTNDKRAFIGKDGSRRKELERLCSTRIMSASEFCTYCNELRMESHAGGDPC